jgi:hypothetical protein
MLLMMMMMSMMMMMIVMIMMMMMMPVMMPVLMMMMMMDEYDVSSSLSQLVDALIKADPFIRIQGDLLFYTLLHFIILPRTSSISSIYHPSMTGSVTKGFKNGEYKISEVRVVMMMMMMTKYFTSLLSSSSSST